MISQIMPLSFRQLLTPVHRTRAGRRRKSGCKQRPRKTPRSRCERWSRGIGSCSCQVLHSYLHVSSSLRYRPPLNFVHGLALRPRLTLHATAAESHVPAVIAVTVIGHAAQEVSRPILQHPDVPACGNPAVPAKSLGHYCFSGERGDGCVGAAHTFEPAGAVCFGAKG